MTRHDMRLGYHPDVLDPRDHIYRDHLTAPPPPPSASLVPNCPPIWNQQTLGCCTGEGSARALAIVRAKAGLPYMEPSVLFIYFNERSLEGTVDSDAGAMVRDGVKTLHKLGVPPSSAWPFDVSKFKEKPSADAYAQATPHRALTYQRIVETTMAGRERAIKTALAAGWPVVFGFTVMSSFESDEVARTGIVPDPQPGEQVLGGHCVVFTGYNDAPFSDVGDQPFFDNSWSESFGRGGRFTMSWHQATNPKTASDYWVLKTVNG
jgi:C1A family cysteine protease